MLNEYSACLIKANVSIIQKPARDIILLALNILIKYKMKYSQKILGPI